MFILLYVFTVKYNFILNGHIEATYGIINNQNGNTMEYKSNMMLVKQ